MDARVLELINLELDGRLDAAGRAELEAILANDPAARTRREQLRAVAQALADAPAPTLPLDFRDSVLRHLPQRSRRASRYHVGLALAASVLVAIGALSLTRLELAGPPEQVGGTMAPAVATVAVTRQERALTLSFALPPEKSELVIELPGAGSLSAAVTGAAEPAIEGRRIVIAAAGGEVIVLVVGNVNEFNASLVRDGVVTPVTVRSH
jgi:hypothetical protein